MDRRKLILGRAAKYEAKHVRLGYYFEPEHGDTVCRPCLHKLIRLGLVVDSDPVDSQAEWFHDDPDAHHDSVPRCDASSFRAKVGCGRTLKGWLTEYGAKEELHYFEEDGFDVRNHEHCYLWMLIDNTFLEGGEERRRLRLLAGIESVAV